MGRTLKHIFAHLLPWLLLATLLAIVVCRINLWDEVAALTAVPFWVWSTAAAAAAALCWLLFRNHLPIVTGFLWIAAGVYFSEETLGVYNELSYAISSGSNSNRHGREQGTLRIVTAHCRDGDLAIAREVVPLEPDIVFLQRAPLESELAELADELYGVNAAVVRSSTSAILARGEFLATQAEPPEPALHARLQLPDGTRLDLTNVDLPRMPPSRRLWEREEWIRLAEQRKTNRRLVRRLLGDYQADGGSPPRIIGGQFGATAGDDIYRPLELAGLHDAFHTSGADWGNTFPSRWPVLRHDQIWTSPRVETVKTRTVSSENSRHRLVYTDFTIRKDPRAGR